MLFDALVSYLRFRGC